MSTIYRGKYPHHIESVWTEAGSYRCRTNAGHVYIITAPSYGCEVPRIGDDVTSVQSCGTFEFSHQSKVRRAAKSVAPAWPAKVEPVACPPGSFHWDRGDGVCQDCGLKLIEPIKAGPIALAVMSQINYQPETTVLVPTFAYCLAHAAGLGPMECLVIAGRAKDAEHADRDVPLFAVTNCTNRLVLKLMIAMELGTQAGEAMVPGAVFSGAFQMARQFGCYDNERLLNVFTNGFLNVIEKRFPRGVPTNRDNVILGEH